MIGCRARCGLWVVCLWLAIAATAAWAVDIPTEPPARSRQVTFYVTYFLTHQQISKHPLDDEIARRLFDEFLEELDPQKSIFLAGDVEEFRQEREQLDDALRRLDVSFAHRVFRRYQERARQRYAWTEELLANPLDFTVDEELVVDAKQLDYPADENEAKDRWRKRLKYECLRLKLNNDNDQMVRDIVRRRYKNWLNSTEQTTSDDLLERYLNALALCYDPHSSYFSPSTYEDFRIRMSLNYQGIGAELESRDGYAVIRRIIPGGAAAKGGELKPNDRIVSVGQGEDGPMVDVVDMKLDDIIDLIRGKEGTVVRLGVLREGETEVRVIKITRARIELEESAASGQIFTHGKKSDGSDYRIGVIVLPSFYVDIEGARHNDEHFRSSTRDVRNLLKKFREEKADLVVLDLRRNGGGSLSEAIGVTGLFLDQGPILQVKDSAGRIEVHRDLDAGAEWTGPLMVLVSRFSASASEILAGAIQDYRRGLIVGDPSTHGKGTVQTLVDIGPTVMKFGSAINLGAVKITMQQFYRPSGASTQNRGVLSDIVLPSLTAHVSKGESELEYALPFDQIPACDYQPLEGYVTDSLIDSLRAASAERIKKSQDFMRVEHQAARLEQINARKVIPLAWEKFAALERDSETDDPDAPPEETHPPLPDQNTVSGIERDFYLEEVFNIAVDYLGHQPAAIAAK
ncbi:MAG: tail-specific protease [Pirellulaceae bacterium]|nr:MAG: tail-specific protease [Pirellulaceae bacterium]